MNRGAHEQLRVQLMQVQGTAFAKPYFAPSCLCARFINRAAQYTHTEHRLRWARMLNHARPQRQPGTVSM